MEEPTNPATPVTKIRIAGDIPLGGQWALMSDISEAPRAAELSGETIHRCSFQGFSQLYFASICTGFDRNFFSV